MCEPVATPDELRRLLHIASVLIATLDRDGVDQLRVLCCARRSIAGVLKRVDALIDAADSSPLTASPQPSNIEAEP